MKLACLSVVAFVVALLCGMTFGKLFGARPSAADDGRGFGRVPHVLIQETRAGESGAGSSDSVPRDDPESLFEHYQAQHSPLASIALAAWAEADPEAALRRVAGFGNFFSERKPLLRVILDVMASQDPEMLLEDEKRITELGGGSEDIVKECAFLALARVNPKAALARALEMDVTVQVYHAIFDQWAREDRGAVESAATDVADIGAWRSAMAKVAHERYREDPVAAREWLRRFPDRDAIDADSIESYWGYQDPEGAAEAFRALLAAEGDIGHDEKRRLFLSCHMALVEGEMLELLSSFAEPRYVAEEVLEEYPLEKRLRYIALLAESEESMYPLADIANDAVAELTERSPDEARKWLQGLPDDSVRGTGLASLLSTFVERDPAGALEMVSRLTDAEAGDLLSHGDVPHFNHLSALEFAAAVEAFESEKLKKSLKGYGLAERIASESIVDAVAWVEGLPKEQRTRWQGRALVRSWIKASGEDFPSVVEWAETLLPEGTGSPEHYFDISRSWNSKDRSAAGAWVSRMENGPNRDAAIHGMIYGIGDAGHRAAFDLANTILDQERRQASLGIVLGSWMTSDASVAAQFLPKADLAQFERERLEAKAKAKLEE